MAIQLVRIGGVLKPTSIEAKRWMKMKKKKEKSLE